MLIITHSFTYFTHICLELTLCQVLLMFDQIGVPKTETPELFCLMVAANMAPMTHASGYNSPS